jgi:hypothetical protein
VPLLGASPISSYGRCVVIRCVSHFIEKGGGLIVAHLTFDPKARRVIFGRVSFHLASSNTVSKFSPTSPTVPHVHQLLNPRRTTPMQINSLCSTRSFYPSQRMPVGTRLRGVGGPHGEDFVYYLFCTFN